MSNDEGWLLLPDKETADRFREMFTRLEVSKTDWGKAVSLATVRSMTGSVGSHAERLPATWDRNPKALLLKALYRVLNLWPHKCRKAGYNCEWVYPYGWVPEAGCPDHDISKRVMYKGWDRPVRIAPGDKLARAMRKQ